MKTAMNIESRLALDLLSESKNSEHQRRYVAVQRYIKAFGLIPHYTQILRELPKGNHLHKQITIQGANSNVISELEDKLLQEPNNPEIVNALDKLYDEAYRADLFN